MSLGDKMFKGVLWSAVDRLSMQSVQFLLGIILARLLTPKEYGTIGLLLVFTAVSKVFVDSGFSAALIQKQNRTSKDISTAFVFNIIISAICYIILWFASPFIANFYDIPLLSILLRVLAISLIINALYVIPSTLFTIELDFKSLAKINFTATLIGGGSAIFLAYNGYGVWALVWQSIIRSTSALILMWVFTKWKLSFVFSKASFKSLFAFGSNLLASSLLNRIVNDLSALFIGKVFTPRDLGLYARGGQFCDFFSSSFGTIIGRVLLPGLSTVQDNIDLLRSKMSQVLKLTALITAPMFLGLFVLSEPLIRTLLTDKWIEAVPIMQVFCIARLITIFCGINLNVLYVIGRTDLLLKQQYLVIAIRVLFVAAALKFGIFYIALSELLATTIHFFINSYFPSKHIGYKSFQQLKDIFPFILISFIMVVLVKLVIDLVPNDIAKLIVGTLLGAVTYYFILKFFHKEDLNLLLNRLKAIKNKSQN